MRSFFLLDVAYVIMKAPTNLRMTYMEKNMPFGKHIYEVRNLMELKRYQNKFMFKRRSVAEHMWSVAKISEGLAIWEEKKFDHPVNMGLLLERCINHDVIEKATGDIIATTKKRTKDMQKALEEIEGIAYEEEIQPDLPNSWQPRFRAYMLNPKADDIEGAILTAADIIDTVLEAIEEVKLGNEAFNQILKDVMALLLRVELDSVKYFIRYAMLDFGLDYANYYGQDVADYAAALHFDPEIFEKN